MRLAILDLPDDRVDLIAAAQRAPGVEIVLVVHHDDDALALKIADVLQIPHSSNPLDLLALKPDQVALPSLESPSAAILSRAGITSGIFASLDSLEEAVTGVTRPKGEASPATEAWEPIFEEPATGRLAQIQEALALTGNRKRLFREVLSLAIEGVDADAGSIMLVDEDKDELRIAFAEGLSHETVRGTRQKIGEGVAGRVARDGRPMLLNQPPGEAGPALDRDRYRINASMSVPIQIDGQVIGVLNVSSGRAGKQFDESDLARVGAIAPQISAILARAVQGVRRDLDAVELRMRREVERALAPTDLPREERLRRAASAVARHLEADAARLYLLDPGGTRLTVLPSGGRGSNGGSRSAEEGIYSWALRSDEALFFAAESAPTAGSEGAPMNLLLAPMRGVRSRGLLGVECVRLLRGEPEGLGRLVMGIASYIARLLDEEQDRDSVERRGKIYARLADLAPRLVMVADLDTLARETLTALRSVFADRCVVVRLRGRDADATSERRILWPEETDASLLRREETLVAQVHAGAADQDVSEGQATADIVRPVRAGESIIGTVAVLAACPGAPSPAEAAWTAQDAAADADAVEKIASYAALAWARLRGPQEEVRDPLDPITGLLAGAGFEARLREEARRAERYRQRFLLTLCAVAEYERLEARHGSAWAGDLLGQFAAALKKNVREVDAVARIGPGRFAVLSPETDKDSGALLRRLDLLLPRLDCVRSLRDPDEVRLVGNQYAFPDEIGSIHDLLAVLRSPSPFA